MEVVDQKTQIIDEKYLLSVFNDRNSLLISLNNLLSNPTNNDLNTVLIQIYCNHFDKYVKYISGKVIIEFIIAQRLDLQLICISDQWHCLSHLCEFVSCLSTKVSISECNGFESLISYLLTELSELSQNSDQLCEDHCFCYLCQTFSQISCHIIDENLNRVLLDFIKFMSKQQKRCFVYKLNDLLINTIKQNDNNILLMQTITDLVFNQNFLTERLDFSDVFHSFGGKYLSKDNRNLSEFDCDVVLLRQSVLLFLVSLSSEYIMTNISDNEIKDRLKFVSEFIRNKCKKFDENDWIIKLFIEEDQQLLIAIYSLIRLGDNQMSHFIMKSMIDSIGSDSSVLLDMLCDEQTAILLLKVLLIYLKLNNILTDISIDVKNVLLELMDKIQRLTVKQLFPYNVKPLMKLLNKLKAF